ncbi:MAG: phospholipase, partial [Betaproteobacteria bacterium]|nr:phospholipase [Betaproteobacteria bacterium]
WLDKPWIWRHRAPAGLNNLVLLCPSKTWIARLPDARLPDRQDFVRFAHDPVARMRRWRVVVQQAELLAEAFERFIRDPGCIRVEPLAGARA